MGRLRSLRGTFKGKQGFASHRLGAVLTVALMGLAMVAAPSALAQDDAG